METWRSENKVCPKTWKWELRETVLNNETHGITQTAAINSHFHGHSSNGTLVATVVRTESMLLTRGDLTTASVYCPVLQQQRPT